MDTAVYVVTSSYDMIINTLTYQSQCDMTPCGINQCERNLHSKCSLHFSILTPELFCSLEVQPFTSVWVFYIRMMNDGTHGQLASSVC